jgi:hypothetical protein
MTKEKKSLKIYYGLTEPSEDMASLTGGISDAEFGWMVERWEKIDPKAKTSHAIAGRIRDEK